MRVLNRHSGFTLVEVVVVLAILGVLITAMYTMFFTNWQAYDNQIVRSELLQDANEIFEMMAQDGRAAKDFVVNNNVENQISVTFIDADDQPAVVYVITNNANRSTLEVVRAGGAAQMLSNNVLFANSTFAVTGNTLNIDLALEAESMRNNVQMLASTQIYSRN